MPRRCASARLRCLAPSPDSVAVMASISERKLIRDVLDPEADLVDPAVEARDLALPAGDAAGRLADDPGERADTRPERLDRVEQAAHPLREHRIDLELRLEGLEVAAHRAEGALGAGERLVAAPLELRQRLCAALLELRQLTVGGSEPGRPSPSPSRRGSRPGRRARSTLPSTRASSAASCRLRRRRRERLFGLSRYDLESRSESREPRLSARILLRQRVGELRRPVVLSHHATRGRADDLAEGVDAHGELGDRLAERIGRRSGDRCPVDSVDRQTNARSASSSFREGREVARPVCSEPAPISSWTRRSSDDTSPRFAAIAARRLAHHRRQRVDPVRERVERIGDRRPPVWAWRSALIGGTGGSASRRRCLPTPTAADATGRTSPQINRRSLRDAATSG